MNGRWIMTLLTSPNRVVDGRTWHKVLDVFIVLDESASVGEVNYNAMVEFVKTFIQDLDSSVGGENAFNCYKVLNFGVEVGSVTALLKCET